MACEHKFVHKGTYSFRQRTGRYTVKFVMNDRYFCEKCLEQKVVKQEQNLGDHEIPERLEDWAKLITITLPDCY